MRVTAKADYAVRAMVFLSAGATDEPVKGEQIAEAQDIPAKYLEAILGDLRTAGLLRSQRGARGGYRLARPADEIAVADVIRAVEGPLATVRGEPAEELAYAESTGSLQELWVAVRAALRHVLEGTTLADVAEGRLPSRVQALAEAPDAWETTAERVSRRLRGA